MDKKVVDIAVTIIFNRNNEVLITNCNNKYTLENIIKQANIRQYSFNETDNFEVN